MDDRKYSFFCRGLDVSAQYSSTVVDTIFIGLKAVYNGKVYKGGLRLLIKNDGNFSYGSFSLETPGGRRTYKGTIYEAIKRTALSSDLLNGIKGWFKFSWYYQAEYEYRVRSLKGSANYLERQIEDYKTRLLTLRQEEEDAYLRWQESLEKENSHEE